MTIFVAGCARAEWRNVHSSINNSKKNNISLIVNQFYSKKGIKKEIDVDIKMEFNQESFLYPFKFKKFYHIIHFLNTKNLDIDIYSDYKITHVSDNYSFVVKLKNKENIKNIIEKISNKKISDEIHSEGVYYEFNLDVNRNEKVVKIKIKESKDKNILDNKKIVK